MLDRPMRARLAPALRTAARRLDRLGVRAGHVTAAGQAAPIAYAFAAVVMLTFLQRLLAVRAAQPTLTISSLSCKPCRSVT